MLRNIDYDLKCGHALLALWVNWVVSIGALAATVVMSVFVTAKWLPVVGLVAILALWARIRFGGKRAAHGLPVVWAVPLLVFRTLVWSVIVMAFITIVWIRGPWEDWFGPVNPRHPYIPILVEAPLLTIASGIALLRRYRYSMFREIRYRMGSLAEQGFIGSVLFTEAIFQIKFTFWQSLLLAAGTTAYYFLVYINVNLNMPDKFAFVWGPLLFSALGAIFLAVRYFSIWVYYSPGAGNNPDVTHTSEARFMIIDHTDFYLSANPDTGVYGTPAIASLPYRQTLSTEEAATIFAEISGLKQTDFRLRFMYKSKSALGNSNKFHFIVAVDNPAVMEGSSFAEGEWFSPLRVSRLVGHHRTTPMLASEMERLHTITMAWKTYDPRGRRLYRIKHYKPTFRLADVLNPAIDFDTPLWLRVADDNEDCRFYSLRRGYRRLLHRDD